MSTWYERNILPFLVKRACSVGAVSKERAKVVPLAHGNVLEIGMGPGFNLPFYDTGNVYKLWGLEPVREMSVNVEEQAAQCGLDFEYICSSAESMPIETNSIDSVVLTFTLCSVNEMSASFSEIRRVLKPAGLLLFAEHGLAKDDLAVQKTQQALNPLWKKAAGGCNLNRDVPQNLIDGGFSIQKIESGFGKGWKFMNYVYTGVAKQQ